MDEYHILQEMELIEDELVDIQSQIDNDFQTDDSMAGLKDMKRKLQQKLNKLSNILDLYR